MCMIPDETERRGWQNPEEILSRTGLKEGDTFVDIGCGKGFFAIPAARIVGKNGKVFAIDANKAFLEELVRKASAEGLKNISVVNEAGETSVPCRGCADMAFFGISLHDFDDAGKVLENAHAMLKGGGKVVDLDWKKEEAEKGPPYRIRFSEEHAIELLKDTGFREIAATEEGRFHYRITAVK
ncbi:MAG: class I SAM-dependent methyltransferase [Candidatus Marsarchaeota archaeon]|nr:class I SAM-dependent methyltransferase [Candidatus Marsarchaeota archaeon]